MESGDGIMDENNYQTTSDLMLKDTDYDFFLASPNNVASISEAFVLCDALEEVVRVWQQGMDAFGMKTHGECAEEAFGAIIAMRLAFMDLKDPLPSTNREEADIILNAMNDAFKPLSRSYAQTPLLSKFYDSIPLKVAATYNKFRGMR
tara:strand:- start:207 stop:650 length:444 start_codon:yes stop_codon:yes gene_type:complete